MSLLLVVLSLLIFIAFVYWRRIGCFINPPTLFSVGLLLSSLSILGCALFDFLRTWSINDIYDIAKIYFLAIVAFLVPWINIKIEAIKPNDEKSFYDQEGIIRFTKRIAVLLLIFVLIAILLLGRLPFLEMMLGKMDIQDQVNSVKNLPMGILSAIVLLSVLFALNMSSIIYHRNLYGISGKEFWWLGFIALFASFWQGNRQLMLIFLFFIIARQMQRQEQKRNLKQSFKKFSYYIGAGLFFIFAFISVQYIRLNGEGATPFELFLYFAWPGLNLLSVVHNSQYLGHSIWPHFILAQIIPNRLLGSGYDDTVKDILFEPTSPGGYLFNWFLDYGFYGIIFGAFLLGFVSKILFIKRSHSEESMRAYLLAVWCCATSGIYSHFISLNFFILPILAIYAISKCTFKRNYTDFR